MQTQPRKRILFSGYAPVHFVCFLPVYERLAGDLDLELWLSGGFKREAEDGSVSFDLDGFYDPFPVDRERVLPVDRTREEDFDVLVCAHLSDALFPRSATRTVQIFHGVSFKNLAVREKALRFDYLCLPGRYHGELYRKQGLIRRDGSKCLLTGFAKNDRLAHPAAPVALLRRLGLDPKLPTILFAPTGEKHNALEVMGREVIDAVRGSMRFNLLVKPHDHPKKKIDWFTELAPLEQGNMRLVRDLDVVPYLAAADVLLTDASSVAFEYTLLDRPIVFLDTPKLFKQVAKRAPAVDLETYGRKIGTIVSRPEELVATIDDLLAHPERHAELRRAAASHIFHGPGSATARVANVVRHAAGLDPELRADIEVLAPEEAAA